MPFAPKSKPPRLPRAHYRGLVTIFWTHTCERRATGWLNQEFHHCFRELMLHAAARYALSCPAYVLMPDHWHIIWSGLRTESDQRNATAFLRKQVSSLLGSARLQDRAYDHVLRSEESNRHALAEVSDYTLMNPVRAGLVNDPREWPYSGAMVAGYPRLDPRETAFWDDYWKILNRIPDVAPYSRPSRAGLHQARQAAGMWPAPEGAG